MDGGGVTTDYLEESWWRPRDPWQVGARVVSGNNPRTFIDQRQPYTYGASRRSLRPDVANETYVDATGKVVSPTKAERKPKSEPGNRKPAKRRRHKRAAWTPMPRHAPFRLDPVEPARVISAPEVLPPSRKKNRAAPLRPTPGWQPPTGADLEELLAELDGARSSIIPSNRKNPHVRD